MTNVLNMLETCGILSFNLSPAALHGLYVHFAQRYRVALVPGGGYDTPLPAPTARDVLAMMEKRMALKDTEIALTVEQHAASLNAFVTWNAKHFVGKLSVPVLTPREWLRGGDRRSGRQRRSRAVESSTELLMRRPRRSGLFHQTNVGELNVCVLPSPREPWSTS